jgi:hypothetical protein
MLVTLLGNEYNNISPLAADEMARIPVRRKKQMVELMGMWDKMTGQEKQAVVAQYPELMGFWLTLISAAVGITKGIVDAVKGKHAAKAAQANASQEQARAKEMEAQIVLKKQDDEKKKKQTMLYAGIGGAVLLLVLLKKK